MSAFNPEELPERDERLIADEKEKQAAEAHIPDPLPSVWPWALGAAVFGLAGLWAGLEFGSRSEIPEPGVAPESYSNFSYLPGILWPVITAVIGVSFWVFRASASEFVRLFRGALLVCVVTGLFAGVFSVLWMTSLHPEILDARIDEMARQMQIDGYSVGDIEEQASRVRKFWGLSGAFVGALAWTIAALVPSVLVVMIGRK